MSVTAAFFAGWPLTAIWLAGLLIGISLFSGLSQLLPGQTEP
jgi:hypothetical protein